MNSLDTLEERIQKPAYLLFLVVILMLLIIGFVNVLSHQSGNPVILGYYSIRHFALILVFLAGIFYWASLIRKPNDDSWLRIALGWVNKRPLLIPVYFLGVAVTLWTILTFERWLEFPALGAIILGIQAILGGLLIFYKDHENASYTWAQRTFHYLFGALIGLELIVQLLTMVGVAPGFNSSRSAFAPYDRIYYQSENGPVNRLASNNGLNVPEFRLEDDSYRIILLGDANLQALPIEPENNLGVLLDNLVLESGLYEESSEMLTLGHPDYGPGVYLWDLLFLLFVDEFEADEVIVFFDLNNDFQQVAATDGYDVFTEVENDQLALGDTDAIIRHDYAHEMLWGIEGVHPGRILPAHYMTGRLIRSLMADGPPEGRVMYEAPADDLSRPNSFLFYEETNDESVAVALQQLREFLAYADEQGMPVRLVTIPAFSEEFYSQPAADDWLVEFGEANLLLPEEILREFAAENDVPFLGLGSYLAQSGLSTAEIQTLFFDNGQGLLQESGHELVAQAVYACFFEQTLDETAGCNNK